MGIGIYKEAELRYIKDRNPITQLYTSDKQISNIEKKVRRVQEKMNEFDFKE